MAELGLEPGLLGLAAKPRLLAVYLTDCKLLGGIKSFLRLRSELGPKNAKFRNENRREWC